MRPILILATVLLISLPAMSQSYKAPTGPAFDAMLKAYSASFQTGDAEGIRKALPALEQAYPGHPYTLYFQAFYYHASGKDIPAAMKGYSDAVRLMPDFSDPYIRRASLFADKGMFDRAVSDMDKAIAAEGEAANAGMYSDRADFKLQAGDAAGALADFRKAVALAPGEAKFYRGVANTALRAGDATSATAIFKTALSGAQKGNGSIAAAYGDFLLRQQQWKEADEQYSLAFRAAGFKPGAKDYNSAGIAAYKLKDYPRAAALLDKGIALDPKDAAMICNRASVAIDQQQWPEVYTLAQQALAADANSSLANMMMAVGIKRTGRGDALAADYEAKAKRLGAEGK